MSNLLSSSQDVSFPFHLAEVMRIYWQNCTRKWKCLVFDCNRHVTNLTIDNFLRICWLGIEFRLQRIYGIRTSWICKWQIEIRSLDFLFYKPTENKNYMKEMNSIRIMHFWGNKRIKSPVGRMLMLWAGKMGTFQMNHENAINRNYYRSVYLFNSLLPLRIYILFCNLAFIHMDIE